MAVVAATAAGSLLVAIGSVPRQHACSGGPAAAGGWLSFKTVI